MAKESQSRITMLKSAFSQTLSEGQVQKTCTKDWFSRISKAPVSLNFRHETKASKMPQGCTNRCNSDKCLPTLAGKRTQIESSQPSYLLFDCISRHYKTPLNIKCYSNTRRFVPCSYYMSTHGANREMQRASYNKRLSK